MKRAFCIILGVMIVGVVIGVPAIRVQAYSVNVSYFFEGLDFDLGEVEVDRTILVLTMGETVDDMLSLDRTYLDDFSPSIDMSIDFNPVSEHAISLLLHQAFRVVSIQDVAFHDIDYTLAQTLEFVEEQSRIAFPADTCLIISTFDHQLFKLRMFERPDFSIDLEYVKLEPVANVPEASTLLLVGVGIIGIVGVMRRYTRGRLVVSTLLLIVLGGVATTFAQQSSITVVKVESSGDGTVLYGDDQCPPGCQQFTLPYKDHAGIVLKAIPDSNSRFVRWKTQQKHSVEGELNVSPGDTIFAVFQDKYELFAEDPWQSESPELYEPFFIRGRYVRLFPEILLQEEHVVLNLFDDISVTVVRERFTEEAERYTWAGSVPNIASLITLSIDKQSLTVTGKVWIDGIGKYSIELYYDDIQAVYEIDQSFFDNASIMIPYQQYSSNFESNQTLSSKWLNVIVTGLRSFFMGNVAYAQTTPVIDVMIFYSPAAEDFAKSRGKDLERQIADTLDETNGIYLSSGINAQLHPVHIQKLENYQEQATMRNDLQQFKAMQEIHDLRNKYNADLVCLLIEKGTDEDDVGGIGDLMVGSGENAPDQAFSVIKRGHALYSWSLVHEFGHNMGACHEQSDAECSSPRFHDSHGYVQHERRWRTIMATNRECAKDGYNCQRVPLFSNPDIPYNGDATGIYDIANNARTLNATAETVAAFRPLSDFSWSIDMPGGAISSCETVSDGSIRCVYVVDTPDYETRTSPNSFITISYAGNSGVPPIHVDEHQVSGIGGLPLSSNTPVVLMIDWAIYSRYHGHWKNLKYYIEYTAGSSQPTTVQYQDQYWPYGPLDGDFIGQDEGHGIHFNHPPQLAGDSLSLELLMSGSIPDNAVHHLATVTVQLSRTLLASGNVYQPAVAVTTAAAPMPTIFQSLSSPVFSNHSTIK